MGSDSAARPEMLFFDVNETLLDLAPLAASIGVALGGRPDLLKLWFTTLLQHSLVTTVADRFRDFGEIAAATLQMVAQSQAIHLGREEARRATEVILRLPPHPDAGPALERLQAAGFRLATLTNSTQSGVDAQMRNAGLSECFEHTLSVEQVGLYKPHTHVYRWAAHRVGVAPERCMLIAAHGWDVAGALWAGLRAAFVARPGQVQFPLGPTPEIVAPDLQAVATRLLELPPRQTAPSA